MDISALVRSLDLAREDDAPELAWLSASHADPTTFWAALAEHARAARPAVRSLPGEAYDLYHDLVGRHAGAARVALSSFDARRGFTSLSFEELDQRASSCAGAWAREGLAPGAIVALVMPFGAAWMVALAAALRLGLAVSVLEPVGDVALKLRLDALGPARVIVDDKAPPPLGAWAEKAIAVSVSGPRHAAAPHAYAPKEPCAMIFSPLRAPVGKPTPLGAEIAWQSALRDGLFVHRLGAGDTLAMPGFPLQQAQPAAVFASMFAGATFVSLGVADVAKDPSLLAKEPITTLGVTPELRDAIRRAGASKLPIGQWFRAVEEPLDWQAWKDFTGRAGLAKKPSQNVLLDAAAGGAVLFSARRPGSVNANVLPAAGRPYGLFDLASGEPATGGAGLFVAAPGDPKKDGYFLLVRRGAEFMWGGTLAPRRGGRVFPATEVEGFVSSSKGVAGASTVPVASGEVAGRWSFSLVVFTGSARTATEGALKAAIDARLSPAHAPDAISLVPLYPHRKGKEVDADWCKRQCASGALARKAAHPLFVTLTELRGLLVEGA